MACALKASTQSRIVPCCRSRASRATHASRFLRSRIPDSCACCSSNSRRSSSSSSVSVSARAGAALAAALPEI
eukprot:1993281-Prymnesium_polylepis.1